MTDGDVWNTSVRLERESVWQIVWELSAVFYLLGKKQPKEKYKNVFVWLYTDVDQELVSQTPTALQMGKVYQRLTKDTLLQDEDYVEGIFRVYNHEICNVIDNYNCSAYFEPSYVIARAYQAGGF